MSFNQPVPVSIENITNTTAGPKVLLDVSVGNNGIAGLPTVYNVSMPLAATEYTFTFPSGTKKFSLKTRVTSNLQYTFQSGQSGTTFVTIPPGCNYSEENLSLSTSLSIYFQSNKPSNTLELTLWI
jgi:hypothetical protein